jgi:hypothetical protein
MLAIVPGRRRHRQGRGAEWVRGRTACRVSRIDARRDAWDGCRVAPVRVHLTDLNRLDERELAAALPAEAITFERPQAAPARHGELLTATAIVIVSTQALRTLAAWLLRTHRSRRFAHSVVIEHPDGSKETRTLSVDVRESAAPEDEVLESLAKLLQLDSGVLGADGQ